MRWLSRTRSLRDVIVLPNGERIWRSSLLSEQIIIEEDEDGNIYV